MESQCSILKGFEVLYVHFGTHFICTIDLWYFFYQNTSFDEIAFIKASLLSLPQLKTTTTGICKATCSGPTSTVPHRNIHNHCQPNMHTCLPLTKMTLKEQSCIVVSLFQLCPFMLASYCHWQLCTSQPLFLFLWVPMPK